VLVIKLIFGGIDPRADIVHSGPCLVRSNRRYCVCRQVLLLAGLEARLREVSKKSHWPINCAHWLVKLARDGGYDGCVYD
jgi:hypothetical protein